MHGPLPFSPFFCLGLYAIRIAAGKRVVVREENVRGFFHRENCILLRKIKVFDIDTIIVITKQCFKKFKKPDLLGLWKNPLAIPCLVGA